MTGHGADVAGGDESIRGTLSETTLAFIGAGVMAEAMIAGLLKRQLLAPERIVCQSPAARPP